MDRIRLFVCFLALVCVLVLACSKNNESTSWADYQLTNKDVVGSFSFEGYTNAGKRELEVNFESDYSGTGTEISTGNTAGLMSVRKFVFKWTINGNKVLMNGVSAKVDTDGNADASVEWSGEFEYAYGVLVPGKNFIEGYAEKTIFNYFAQKYYKDINSTATFDLSSGEVSIIINTGLDRSWDGMSFKYGYRINYQEYTWGYAENGALSFSFLASCYSDYKALLSLAQKERDNGSLTNSEKSLRQSYIKSIEEYANSFKKGKTEFTTAVNASFVFRGTSFNRIFDIEPDYSVTGSLDDLKESGSQGGNGDNELDPKNISGDGSSSNPYSISGAVNALKKQGAQELQACYISGVVTEVTSAFTAGRGTATFSLADKETSSAPLLFCTDVLSFDNQPWLNGDWQIKKGNVVCLYSKISMKNGQYVTGSSGTYLYRLNNKPRPEIVDMGLRVKWASANLGAKTENDYGSYYSWGETSTKEINDWAHYKWCEGSKGDHITKYNTDSSYGPVDYKTQLEIDDDAAYAVLRGHWRMPTMAEFQELIENCTYKWISQNYRIGAEFTSKKNGNKIFIPAAGGMGSSERSLDHDYVFSEGESVLIWTSTLYVSASSWALSLSKYYPSELRLKTTFRSYAYPIRAVNDY